MKIITFNNNIYEENAYLIIDRNDITLIDPGYNKIEILSFLESNNLKLNRIFLTHGHLDHIGELLDIYNEYKDSLIYISYPELEFLYNSNLNLSLYGNKIELDKNIKINTINNNDSINGYVFYITPGHTKGSMIIKKDKYLFTGDTLFKSSIGRTDFPTGSINDMKNTLLSIPKMFSMNSIIYPGHGEKTTLKEECLNNYYLKN